ncbi:hypothetical protein OSTOST_08204 [Ostertagia ostertagi]
MPLVYTIRCIRDSTLCTFAQKSYEVVLKGLIRLAAMTVCIFVNTGRCDFADRVFVEAQSTKLSPDRNGYGEIWESNFSVSLPSSPDLNPRLCREVVKQGVLVRLLRTDIATVSGEFVDLLKLYNIEDSQVVVDLNAELLKVSAHVDEVFEETISPPTLENLVEWIVSECKLSHLYKLRSELEAQRFDRRHIMAINIDIGKSSRARVGVENRRLLFYCCLSMLRLVAGTRDHVLTEVDAVLATFQDVTKRRFRRAMKNMMQRTLLDMSNLTTGRTIGVICESCVRFAQAMNSGDDASAFIHHRTFDEHAQLLRESGFY